MNASTRLLASVTDAVAALADVRREHGRSCDCILCREAAGLRFVLALVQDVTANTLTPSEWPKSMRRKRK